jgi:hypothetical protein
LTQIVTGLLVFPPGRVGSASAPSLEATFYTDGTISVTPSDVTAVGSTSGVSNLVRRSS